MRRIQPLILFICLLLCCVRVDATTTDERIQLYTAYSCIALGDKLGEGGLVFLWSKNLSHFNHLPKSVHYSVREQASKYFSNVLTDEYKHKESSYILDICRKELDKY